jgi:hypothetical protein
MGNLESRIRKLEEVAHGQEELPVIILDTDPPATRQEIAQAVKEARASGILIALPRRHRSEENTEATEVG